VYPTLAYDSTTGALAGGRFVARDLFGAREHLAVRAATGGRDREIITGAVHTGERLGRVGVELGAEHERRVEHFYGIGNASDMKLDYRQQLRRASAILDIRLVRELHVRMAGALAAFEFEGDEMTSSALRYAYGDLELTWDSRGRYTRWEPASLASIGWLASAYAGRFAVEDGRDFWRYGGDAQHFLRLANGPRVIATRLHVEAVSAPADELPFDELAKLGGKTLLRGYPTDRYRDRVAVLGTLEYRWDLAWFLVASTFVDAGRVAPSFAATHFEDLRVGYGVGLEAYTETSFVIRASVASSIDGGLFFNIAFDPAFELDPRVDRR
jgi:outer membrane translocation and assembly module TamA